MHQACTRSSSNQNIFWGTVGSCTVGLEWAFGCQWCALLAVGQSDYQGGGKGGKKAL